MLFFEEGFAVAMGDAMLGNAKTIVVPKGFLRRKFIHPSLPQPYVAETAVSERILDVDSWRVCLVSAAPGYGKSTLLAQWFLSLSEKERVFPLWITLDARDSDPVRFARSLLVAFQQVNEGFSELLPAAGEEAGVAPDDVLTEVVNAVDEFCDPNVAYPVFFDDYDQAACESFDDAFSFLNRYAPDNIRLIAAGSCLSTRMEDLLVDSSVIEVRTEDIAFSDDRLREFAFNLIPDLTQEEYRDVSAMADGWPAEFVFYRLAKRRAGALGDPAAFMEGYHSRFFDRTMLRDVGAEMHEFLIETSFLDSLEPELCAHVTGSRRAGALIEELAGRNMFLSPAKGGGYAFNPPFKRHLQSKLLALTQSQIAGLARKAAAWCIDNGREAETLKYVAMASDPYFLEACTRATGAVSRTRYRTLAEYLVETPSARFSDDGFLTWISLWAAISAGRIDLAREVMKRVRRSTGHGKGDGALHYVEALCAALEGDNEKALSIINEVLSADGDLPSSLQCLLTHMRGECLERLGSLRDSQMAYQRSLSLAEREDTPFYRLFDLYLLARQAIDVGKIDEAVRYASRALGECQEDSSLYGEFNAILAFASIIRNRLDEAKTLIGRALSRVSPDSNIDMYVDVQVVYARYLQARGNKMAALEATDDVIKATRGKRVPRNLAIEAWATKASISVRAGDIASAMACEYELDGFSDDPDVLRAVPCIVAKAELELFRGERDLARTLLSKARRRAQECASTRFLAEIGVEMACLESTAGNDDQAMIELGKAVELAMASENINVFVKGAAEVRDLLIKLATNRKASSTIRSFSKRVLLAFGSDSEVENDLAFAKGDALGFYALTEREREILRCLNSGMSRAEIAEALSVSQNTVKTHLKNVYAKLGVHSRAEAYKMSPEALPQQQSCAESLPSHAPLHP